MSMLSDTPGSLQVHATVSKTLPLSDQSPTRAHTKTPSRRGFNKLNWNTATQTRRQGKCSPNKIVQHNWKVPKSRALPSRVVFSGLQMKETTQAQQQQNSHQ